MVNTFTAGHELLQFPSTSSSAAGPIYPMFNLSASTSTAEFATIDDTLATGYETSEFLFTLSGPSQHAGTSVGKFTIVDDILAAGYEMLWFLSTLSGPTDLSQPTFWLWYWYLHYWIYYGWQYMDYQIRSVTVFIHLVKSLSTYLQLGCRYLCYCCWWIGCRTWWWVNCRTQSLAIFIRWHGSVHAVEKWLKTKEKGRDIVKTNARKQV